MTSFLPGRRRAERFAQAVEGTRTTEDPRLTPLLEVVDRVRLPAEIEPSEQFSTDLRQRLLAEATAMNEAGEFAEADNAAAALVGADAGDSDASGSGNHPPTRRSGHAAGARRMPTRPRTRVLAATTAVSLVAGMFGIVTFAREAMPGETLYGLKRSLEQTQTVIATNSASRGEHYLASGRTRLSELGTLVEREQQSSSDDRNDRAGGHDRDSGTDRDGGNDQSGQHDQDGSDEDTQDQQRTTATGDPGSTEPTPPRTDSGEQPQTDADRVTLARKTLKDFARQTEQGGRLLLQAYEKDEQQDSLERLEKFTKESGRELATLAPLLPEELGDSFTEATRVLYELDEQISAYCPDCTSLRPTRDDEPAPTPDDEDPRTPDPSPSSRTPSPTPSNTVTDEPSPDRTESPSPTGPSRTSPTPTPTPSPTPTDPDDDTLPLPTELPLPL